MEQVLNASERKYAFGKYIIFFSITVAIIVAAVYFDTLIPQNENELLRNKIGNIEAQEYKQKEFIAAMEEVKSLNDSLSKIGIVHPLVERGITEQLSIMNRPSHQENALYGSLNKDLFNFTYEYTEMNKRLINLKKDLKEIEQLKAELNRTQVSLEEANRSLDAYRNSANLGIDRH
ncbi:type VI secretion system TssO [Pontibacter toksunensis]|uniref:Type VI secretion system TssO n=1 Tax=Pontibacter toksunensis TaxID=1332631 RepID=A0ABW6BS10_9BACT